jgi:hypothetical protein
MRVYISDEWENTKKTNWFSKTVDYCPIVIVQSKCLYRGKKNYLVKQAGTRNNSGSSKKKVCSVPRNLLIEFNCNSERVEHYYADIMPRAPMWAAEIACVWMEAFWSQFVITDVKLARLVNRALCWTRYCGNNGFILPPLPPQCSPLPSADWIARCTRGVWRID